MNKLLLMCVALTMSACQYPILVGLNGNVPGQYAVHIQSDTRWHGTVSGEGVTGFTTRTVNVPAGMPVCFTVHKETAVGLLRVYIMPQNVAPGTVAPLKDKATTSPYGVVSGCL